MCGGVGLVDPCADGLPLSKVGVIVVAAQKVKQWEAIVGKEYLSRIGTSQAPSALSRRALTPGTTQIMLKHTKMVHEVMMRQHCSQRRS